MRAIVFLLIPSCLSLGLAAVGWWTAPPAAQRSVDRAQLALRGSGAPDPRFVIPLDVGLPGGVADADGLPREAPAPSAPIVRAAELPPVAAAPQRIVAEPAPSWLWLAAIATGAAFSLARRDRASR